MIRWAPTWLQIADALTKETPEAMDLLRAAMNANRYHLNRESTMMEAAAHQRQLRLSRKVPTVGEKAQTADSESQVHFIRSYVDPMVKVPVEKISEEEIRSLFECMVSGCVLNGEEFQKHMQQSRSMCKARIPARDVNNKQFGGEDTLLTFTFTKTTKMIQIQGSATMLDRAEATLKKVLEAYGTVLRGGNVIPLPEGCQKWGAAIKESLDGGSVSSFLESQRAGAAGESKTEEPVKSELISKQSFVPEDEEFIAAVAELCNEGARRLHRYPAWRNKYLQFMLKEFNASTDQVLHLSELWEEMNEGETMEQWTFEEPMHAAAKPKARPDGYRPSTKKEF